MKDATTCRQRIVALVLTLAIGAVPMYAGSAHAATGASHAPIVIQSDGDFMGCTCVTGGSGTPSDPYIIGPWTINNTSSDAVTIDGTNLTKSFELLNLSIGGNSGNKQTGIVLNHINPGGTQAMLAEVYGAQTTIQTDNVGVLVENSHHVTLDGAGENPSGPGIANSGAGTINKNVSGAIDVESSSHVTIKGWQLSANGPSINPDWITLDPSVSDWAVGGVRFFGVTYSTIDHNAANNDGVGSFTLFNSSHNTLSNNLTQYPYALNFLLTDGSSYNTVMGNDEADGDFVGLLVADPLPGKMLKTYGASHDNVIENNQIHTNGPTGAELNANIAPAFVGGLVVLNGTYNNIITNNQTWASTGSDLAWAQVVPNPSTPIGIDTYPPLLHCNVTASEGGGGVTNLNGNVWKGNTYQKIDPCLPTQ